LTKLRWNDGENVVKNRLTGGAPPVSTHVLSELMTRVNYSAYSRSGGVNFSVLLVLRLLSVSYTEGLCFGDKAWLLEVRRSRSSLPIDSSSRRICCSTISFTSSVALVGRPEPGHVAMLPGSRYRFRKAAISCRVVDTPSSCSSRWIVAFVKVVHYSLLRVRTVHWHSHTGSTTRLYVTPKVRALKRAFKRT